MSQYFGWELLYRSVESEITSKADFMVAVFHWLMIRENYLCLGVGNERDITDEEDSSELLPAGWNADQENYILRYLHHTDQDWIITNFAFDEEKNVGTLTITRGDTQIEGQEFAVDSFLPDFVPGPQTKRKIQVFMPRVDTLMYKFHTIMKPIKDAKPGAAVPKPEPAKQPKPDPYPPIPVPQYPDVLVDPQRTPFGGIGQRDLDPFGGRATNPLNRFDPFNALPRPGIPDGGGMLGTIPDPFRRDNRLPNPRYDPINPFARRGPNPDHFQPPGFGDDMFL